MGKYLLRRMFTLIFVLWGMSLVTFSISNVVPVDPAAAAAGMEGSPEVIERIRKELGSTGLFMSSTCATWETLC